MGFPREKYCESIMPWSTRKRNSKSNFDAYDSEFEIVQDNYSILNCSHTRPQTEKTKLVRYILNAHLIYLSARQTRPQMTDTEPQIYKEDLFNKG